MAPSVRSRNWVWPALYVVLLGGVFVWAASRYLLGAVALLVFLAIPAVPFLHNPRDLDLRQPASAGRLWGVIALAALMMGLVLFGLAHALPALVPGDVCSWLGLALLVPLLAVWVGSTVFFVVCARRLPPDRARARMTIAVLVAGAMGLALAVLANLAPHDEGSGLSGMVGGFVEGVLAEMSIGFGIYGLLWALGVGSVLLWRRDRLGGK